MSGDENTSGVQPNNICAQDVSCCSSSTSRANVLNHPSLLEVTIKEECNEFFFPEYLEPNEIMVKTELPHPYTGSSLTESNLSNTIKSEPSRTLCDYSNQSQVGILQDHKIVYEVTSSDSGHKQLIDDEAEEITPDISTVKQETFSKDASRRRFGRCMKNRVTEEIDNRHGTCEALISGSDCNNTILFHTANIITSESNTRSGYPQNIRDYSPSKTYTCKTCDKTIYSRGGYYRHMQNHKGITKKFICDICEKQFRYKCHLSTHMDVHADTRIRSHVCSQCGSSYVRQCGLTEHMLTHHHIRRYECGLCNKVFTKKDSLSRHLKLHTDDKMYVCHICNKRFIQKYNLFLHQKRGGCMKSHACNLCFKSFIRSTELEQHLEQHGLLKRFKCAVCGESFIQKSHLEIHLFHHENDKSFKCSICHMIFITNETLSAHLKIHNNENYECVQCSKSLSCKLHLNMQYKICERKNLLFGVCSTSSNNLSGEDRTVKKFFCDICWKSFKTKVKLSNHMYTHSSVRNFRCSVCNMMFKTSKTLRSHLKTHGDKIYKCILCPRSFFRRPRFIRHLKTHEQMSEIIISG